MGYAARLVAAVALTAATGAVVPAAPAAAATCSTADGVSVVVDFSGVAGGTETTCVPEGGGDSAASLFEVHHDLTRVNQFPQAVCRVDGVPQSDDCQNMPPADAYWGLFWSDGSGGWVYSSESVDALNVPDGGSVAFAWQDGGETDQPGVAPPQHNAESSSPTPSPSNEPDSSGGGSRGSSGGGSTGSAGSAGATGGPATSSSSPDAGPSTSPSGSGAATGGGDDKGGRTDRPGRERGERAGKGEKPGKDDRSREAGDDTTAPSASADAALSAEPPAAAGDGGLPAWVAPAGIAGLFAVAGAVALLRRRALS